MPRSPKPIPERFWPKVDKRGPDECWPWKSCRRPNGYGSISVPGGATLSAHRLSWELANGRPVPEGLVVMHACDNPGCVNPAHLSVGTFSDNARDSAAKGRCAGQRVTHCPKGHEYTPENTLHRTRGRACRACHCEQERLRRAANKAKELIALRDAEVTGDPLMKRRVA
jgi:hypothetical protein